MVSASSRGSHSDGSFLRQYQEPTDEKVKQMCGKGMIDKILRKSALSTQQMGPIGSSVMMEEDGSAAKSCLSPALKLNAFRRRYSEVPETMMLQDTDSSSGASDHDWGDDIVPHESFDRDVAQFDPSQIQFTPEGDQIEVEHGSTASTPSSSSSSSGRRQGVSPHAGSWSLTLPSVAEESYEEDSDVDEEGGDHAFGQAMNAEESKVLKEVNGDENSKAEKKKVMVAMRELVLKQQAAIKELSDQNYQYRCELADQQIAVLRLKQETEKQQTRIEELEKEKYRAEFKAIQLRTEATEARSQFSQLQQTPLVRNGSGKRDSETFERQQSALRSNDAEVAAFQPFKTTNSQDSSKYRAFKATDSQDSSKYRNFETVVDRSTSSLSTDDDDDPHTIKESRSDVIFSIPRQRDSDREPPSNYSVSTGQVDPSITSGSRQSFGGRSTPTPEEVALYRSRLEAIQKRRQMRKPDNKAVSKVHVPMRSAVRFK